MYGETFSSTRETTFIGISHLTKTAFYLVPDIHGAHTTIRYMKQDVAVVWDNDSYD